MQTLLSVGSIALYTFLGLLALVFTLHLVGKFGPPGRAIARLLCRAPALDVVVASLTWLRWVVGWLVATYRVEVAGCWGVLASLVGEVGSLFVWLVIHE
ncbi:MAG: hypothetical protein ACT4PL_10940, partial [Phycisphaerales bacterium]